MKQKDESIIKIEKAIIDSSEAIAVTGIALTVVGFKNSGTGLRKIPPAALGAVACVTAGAPDLFAAVRLIGLGMLAVGGLIGGGFLIYKKWT